MTTVVDLASSQVWGALMAVAALAFWFEAPALAQRGARDGDFTENDRLRYDGRLPPDPRRVKALTAVLRSIAVACLVVGVLFMLGVLTSLEF